MFLTADSIGDFLNKSTYVKAMSEYDRKMMDEYIAQKEAVAAAKAVLESEEEELELMADAAKEQKETVEALIKKKTAEIQSYQAQIDSQNSEAAEVQLRLCLNNLFLFLLNILIQLLNLPRKGRSLLIQTGAAIRSIQISWNNRKRMRWIKLRISNQTLTR